MDVNPVTRSLNSMFIISLGHDAYVTYSIDITSTLSLTGGQVGTVFLEYADDDDFTQNITEVCRFVNGNTGTLALGLSTVQESTAQLSGMIPATKRVKLRTQQNTGTPAFSWKSGQEAVI